MTTIILITPILRTSNLIYIAKNIVERFKTAKELKPLWILAFDKYHADIRDESIKPIKDYCEANGLNYRIYLEGVDAETNYGGALMNFPLSDVKKQLFENENPLVYVLDDDNILHKNFIPFIETYCINNENVWWLNMLDEFGTQRFSRKIDRLAFIQGTGPNQGYKVIHRCSSCDPSQVLIRLDKLLELGGFGSTIMYDYNFMSKIYQNQNNIDDLLCYAASATQFGNAIYGDFRTQCYHNGLVTNENIESAIKDLEENFSSSTEDSYIRIYTNNYHFNLELTNEEVLKILKGRLSNNEISE